MRVVCMFYPCNGILHQSGFQSLLYIATRFYEASPIYWNHPSNLYQNSQFALLSYTIFVLHFLHLWFTILNIFFCFQLCRSRFFPLCLILIHQILQWAVGRQGRQDRQWSDSIGRTVLQMVTQKPFALCYRTIVCLCVCLSVCLSCNTLVYCGQTVGGLMPLGTEVGLGPGHIVLDGTQVPHRKQPSSPQVFGRCLLWLNGRPSQQLLSCS